jgi:hypothetical protein
MCSHYSIYDKARWKRKEKQEKKAATSTQTCEKGQRVVAVRERHAMQIGQQSQPLGRAMIGARCYLPDDWRQVKVEY